MNPSKLKNSVDLARLSSRAKRSGVERPRVPKRKNELNLENVAQQRRFRRALLTWYDANKRALPWRVNRDPYRVWIAEVMLQQTRVAAVVEYYQRFLKRFPTVQKLASARQDSVLAAWSGLGYYRRARALHASAKEIVKDHGGQFPQSAEHLRHLPGIGRYTSAAIASIAFGEAVAVVDGNVERVLSRTAGKQISGEQSWTLAQTLLSESRSGDFNQAMMELGATICLPQDPQCLLCPVHEHCLTRGELAGSTLRKRQKREIYYTLSLQDESVLLRCRSGHESLMAGMWELPEIPRPDSDTSTLFRLRHSITVTDYTVRVCQNGHAPVPDGRWFHKDRLSSLALTGLARKILRTAGII